MHAVYGSQDFARSLSHAGRVIEMPHSGGWVLERPIGSSGLRDAMGCYPITCLQRWEFLESDLTALAGMGLVSLTMVTDPFAPVAPRRLSERFQVVRPFRRHFVADLGLSTKDICSAHHRYYARYALRSLDVDVCWRPADYVDEWSSLYAESMQRLRVSDLRRFSRAAFDALFQLDGVLLLRACRLGTPVAAEVFVLQGEVAHAHLMANTLEGYRDHASYALHWTAIECLRPHAAWLNFGGGTALDDGENGLTWYKRGWSTSTRQTWLLGAILDPPLYTSLCGEMPAPSAYFPGYRAGEFAVTEQTEGHVRDQ